MPNERNFSKTKIVMELTYLYNAAETYQKGLQSFGMHAPLQLLSQPPTHPHTHTHTPKLLYQYLHNILLFKKKN